MRVFFYDSRDFETKCHHTEVDNYRFNQLVEEHDLDTEMVSNGRVTRFYAMPKGKRIFT